MTVFVLAILFAGCTRGPTHHASYPMDQLPADLSGPVSAADNAIKELQQRLVTRLSEEIERSGPMGAINVCRNEASAITAAVQRDRSIAVGRTSHRLRNPQNAPGPWMLPYVEAAAGKQAAEVDAVAVDLGDRVGVLRPIPTGGVCITCHGPADTMALDLREAIRAAYPDDLATGFAEGELRGFFWAEAPK